MTTSNDYFSRWEEGLWAALEGFPRFADLVPIGNRIRMTGDSNNPLAKQDNLGAADIPQVFVMQAGGDPLSRGTSNTDYAFTQRYQIVISTDQMRTNQRRSINPIKAAVFGALLSCMSRGTGGKLPGCPEVNACLPVSWADEMDERGWWFCSIVVAVEGAVPREMVHT